MFEDFALFFICHNKVDFRTFDTVIKKYKYSGPWYIIIDDKDKSIEQFQKKYGEERVKIFSKTEVWKKIDMMDNFTYDSVITFARNACFDIANEIGVKYFLTLDDDYDSFRFRFPGKPSCPLEWGYFDKVVQLYLDFYRSHENINVLAFCQGSDLSAIANGKVLRKAMNGLFFSTKRRVWFKGHLNEDVTTYTRYNQLGHLFLTLPSIQLNQQPTQTGGGISGVYEKYGTYTKTFYSVMQCPSFIKVSTFTKGFRMSKFRIHHKIDSELGYAQVISSRYKK